MNDSDVRVVSPQHVRKQQAYILFYVKRVPAPTPTPAPTTGPAQKSEQTAPGNAAVKPAAPVAPAAADDDGDVGVAISDPVVLSKYRRASTSSDLSVH